jgi:hypothetical protein
VDLAPDLFEFVEGKSRVGRRHARPTFVTPRLITPLPGLFDLGLTAEADLHLFLKQAEAVI